MSVFHGPQGKGAMAAHRARKREQAAERNARTPDGRRSTKRRKRR